MPRPDKAQRPTIACRGLFLVEDVDGFCIVAQFVEIHPVIRAEGFFLGPDFVECVRVIERASFHHHGDVRGIVDIVQRIGIQHHQIGEFANF